MSRRRKGGIEMAASAIPSTPTLPREHYLNAKYGIRSWLLTTDHKRIALLYLASVTFFFMLGGIFAFIIRLNLLTPQGNLVSPETYNKLFTMHGVAMIFFFLVPSIPSVLGNFLIPLIIGAKDLAFPNLTLLSWYLNITCGCFLLYSSSPSVSSILPSVAIRFSSSISSGSIRILSFTSWSCPQWA